MREALLHLIRNSMQGNEIRKDAQSTAVKTTHQDNTAPTPPPPPHKII